MIRKSRLFRTMARLVPRSYRMASILGSRGLRVALYHHISETECDFVRGLGVTTPPETLESHLDHFQRNYDVVDLDTVFSGRQPKRPLLITFDDAYRSVLEIAAPLLRLRKMPAVFFVSPGCIAGGPAILENVLCYLCNTRGVFSVAQSCGLAPLQCRRVTDVTAAVSRLSYDDRLALADRLAHKFDVDLVRRVVHRRLYLDTANVAQLSDMGIEIGNHTLNHVPCGLLNDVERIDCEIISAQRQLEAWTSRRVRAFSFPFGRWSDASAPVCEVLARTGHRALFFAGGGGNPITVPDARRLTFDRVDFDREHADELFVNLELLPVIRDRLRGRSSLVAEVVVNEC